LCVRRHAVKKELVSTAADLGTPAVLWLLLLGEIAIASLFLLSGRLPPILTRSLQLFLRF
jgi:hypothetical protein